MNLMRLIDADKLKKEIHRSYSDDLGILEKIDDQPTIYDLNEIIKQLEKAVKILEETAKEDFFGEEFIECIVYAIQKAIDIVKDGVENA